MASPAETPIPSRQESLIDKTSGAEHTAEIPSQHQDRIDLGRKSNLGHFVSGRSQLFSVYNQLFTLVLLSNAAVLVWTFTRTATPLNTAVVAAAANVLAAILVRQDYVVNAVYAGVSRVPHSLPLPLRASLVRVYEHGGIHVGCAVAGTGWFIVFTVLVTVAAGKGRMRSVSVLAVSYTLALLMLAIVVCAHQRLRFKYHDVFETTHRYAGWLSMFLFWIGLALITHASLPHHNVSGLGAALVRAPAFWLLLATTAHLVLPWLRLRRIRFEPTVLSDSALRLDFDGAWPSVTGIQLSVAPLREWHPFATFPAPDQIYGEARAKKHSVLISRAGDWTRAQIAAPRQTYWVRGWPRAGLLQLALAFSRVVIVTTGAGIGPALSLLLADEQRRACTACRLVWCASAPGETLGHGVCAAVARADPRAVVIDSRGGRGRPDLLAVAYAVWREERAEAVFVISNRAVTGMVVGGLQEAGVHAFGPIWDS
jgi:hypothetical protein